MHVDRRSSAIGCASGISCGGLLGRQDAGEPRGPEHLALRRVAGRDRRRRLRATCARAPAPARAARSTGLGADVDHPRAAAGVEVGQRRSLSSQPRVASAHPARLAAVELALPDRRLAP